MPIIHRFDDDEDDEKTKAQQSIPVDKHLFDARQVMVIGQISMDLAKDVCQRLLALSHVSNDPITVMVSSPGGHVESGDMIHDTIGLIRPKVNILGMGWVASAGALVYISVPKERRFLFAATADRLAPPEQAYALWRHWEKPEMAWYHGSHVSFFLEEKVQHFVAHALTKSAVRILARKPRRTRKRSQPPRDRSRSARL